MSDLALPPGFVEEPLALPEGFVLEGQAEHVPSFGALRQSERPGQLDFSIGSPESRQILREMSVLPTGSYELGARQWQQSDPANRMLLESEGTMWNKGFQKVLPTNEDVAALRPDIQKIAPFGGILGALAALLPPNVVAPVARGGIEAVGGLSNPENLPYVLAPGGIGKLMVPAFMASTIPPAVGEVGTGLGRLSTGDTEGLQEVARGGLTSLLMGAPLGHMLRKEAPQGRTEAARGLVSPPQAEGAIGSLPLPEGFVVEGDKTIQTPTNIPVREEPNAPPPTVTTRLIPSATEEPNGVVRVSYRDEQGNEIGYGQLDGKVINMVSVSEPFQKKGYGAEIIKDLRERGGLYGVAGTKEGLALMRSKAVGAREYEPNRFTFDPETPVLGGAEEKQLTSLSPTVPVSTDPTTSFPLLPSQGTGVVERPGSVGPSKAVRKPNTFSDQINLTSDEFNKVRHTGTEGSTGMALRSAEQLGVAPEVIGGLRDQLKAAILDVYKTGDMEAFDKASKGISKQAADLASEVKQRKAVAEPTAPETPEELQRQLREELDKPPAPPVQLLDKTGESNPVTVKTSKFGKGSIVTFNHTSGGQAVLDTHFGLEDNNIYLGQLEVPKEQRGKGVGEALFNSVVNFAKEKGKTLVGIVYTGSINEDVNMVRFLQKRGALFDEPDPVEYVKHGDGVGFTIDTSKTKGVEEKPSASPEQARYLSSSEQVKMLGLDRPGATVHSALSELAKRGVEFGTIQSGLADFLVSTFPEVLRTAKAKTGLTEGRTYAGYDPIPHTSSTGVGDQSPAWMLLHEGAHAATWWSFEHPKTAMAKVGVATVRAIREQAIRSLSPDVQNALKNEIIPLLDKAARGDVKAYQELPNVLRKYKGPVDLYSLTNDQEFLAGIFSSHEHRDFLDSFQYEGRSAWQQVKDSVKNLLGIGKEEFKGVSHGSGLDAAFNAMMEVGRDPEVMKGINKARAKYGATPLVNKPPAPPVASQPFHGPPSPQRTRSVIRDLTLGGWMKGKANQWAGRTAPKTTAANEEVGNKTIRYASSRLAAPEVARALANDVLVGHEKDTAYDLALGSLILEDQKRQIRQGHLDAAAKATDPVEKAEFQDLARRVTSFIGDNNVPFKTEAEYQQMLKDPLYREGIERHKQIIMPVAEQAHVELGGKLAKGGEQTGAFANMMAIMGPDNLEATRDFVYGTPKGDLTTSLRRGSVFSKVRKGTAAAYDVSYRSIAERMIRGNYEQKALRDMYQAYIDKGLAVEQKAGQPAPTTIKGQKTDRVVIELRGAGPGQTRHINLFVRHDLAPELRQALHTDNPIERGGLGLLADALTSIQVVGPTDAVWHTASMISSIVGSQGGKNVFVDLARKVPIVNVVDAVSRVAWHMTRTLVEEKGGFLADALAKVPGLDVGSVAHERAKIAEVGAGRAKSVHRSIGGKFGVPEWADPSYLSGKALNWLDKGGRLTLNKMFDSLVERGLTKDTILDRREFINQMGQYNSRLMSRVQEIARELSLSSFVVAGRNFNRLAMRRLLLSQNVRAANPQAWFRMKVVDAVSMVMTLLAIPVVANLYLTGKSGGRPGTPPGSIDTGKDDKNGKPIVFDPLQALLYRRGLRITGLQAAYKGYQDKLPFKETAQNMTRDFANGVLHPWAGPSVRVGFIAMTGSEFPGRPMGQQVSKNPYDYGENVLAAGRSLFPLVSEFKQARAQGESGVQGIAKKLGGALGVKSGGFPTKQERLDTETAKMYPKKTFDTLTIGERLMVERAVESKAVPNQNEVSKNAASERMFWHDIATNQRLEASLPEKNKDWLKKNNLDLPGFKPEKVFNGVRLPTTQAEQTEAEALFLKWYKVMLDRLEGVKGFEALPQSAKKKVLSDRLDDARTAARGEWLQSINRRTQPNRSSSPLLVPSAVPRTSLVGTNTGSQ